MAVISNRYQPRLQFLQARDTGHKYSANLLIIYKTGQSNPPEYRIRVANHYLFRNSDSVYPEETGKITFSITETGWTTTRIQAKEVANSDPNSLGQDIAVDGAYANLNGFSVESIKAGGYRDVLLKIDGTGLTFDDLYLQVTAKYPS